jgi:hypothetical protein
MDSKFEWTTKIRSWWKTDSHMVWVALCLCPAAIFIPRYLIKNGHHPPIGTYIAILGTLAAAVTFRKDPPLKEKAAWIFLISMLMVAEIRNLYIADAEQAETFIAIRSGLQVTKQGLDTTVQSLQTVAGTLQGISGKITETETNNQRHFDATMGTTKEVLNKTSEAAATADEAVKNITGGDSWGSVEIVNLFDKPDAVGFIVRDEGRYPLRGVKLVVLGDFGGKFPSLSCNDVGDVSPLIVTVARNCFVYPKPNEPNKYEIYINAINGTTVNDLVVTKSGGLWKSERLSSRRE